MSKENNQQPFSPEENPEPLFGLGEVVITRGAFDFLGGRNIDPLEYIFRHVTGDFGELDPEDLEANRRSIEQGGSMILSSFKAGSDQKVWVITEWDRSVTTILLPSEY